MISKTQYFKCEFYNISYKIIKFTFKILRFSYKIIKWRSPQLLGTFLNFLEKKAILMPLYHISHMFGAI